METEKQDLDKKPKYKNTHRKGYWKAREQSEKRRLYLKNYRKEYEKRDYVRENRRIRDRTKIKSPATKERIKRNWRKKIDEISLRVLSIKKNSGCSVCKWNEHPEILQFHHRNPEEKSFDLSVETIARKEWIIVEKEISKCDIICPNCHWWLHYSQNKLLRGKK